MKWIVLVLIVVSASQATVKRCESKDDCEENECCRFRHNVPANGGLCMRYRMEGEICPLIVDGKFEKPDTHQFMCPCMEGLECVPDREVRVNEFITVRRPVCVAPGN